MKNEIILNNNENENANLNESNKTNLSRILKAIEEIVTTGCKVIESIAVAKESIDKMKEANKNNDKNNN